MEQAEDQFLFDLLDDHQKSQLNAIRRRIESSGNKSLDFRTGDRVIEILESWLLDDEQKQHLAANAWDIFFLYAAASLLNLKDDDGAESSGRIAAPKNTSEIALSVEPAKIRWPSFDILDRQQADIRFIRINHSRFDLLHDPENTASNSHGYIHRWQQRVIDGYKEKGAGKARRAERQAQVVRPKAQKAQSNFF